MNMGTGMGMNTTPRTTLVPRTGHAPGEALWGAPPRQQQPPLLPLLAIAVLTLLVAAPAAMSSSGQSGNPLVLVRSMADATYTVTMLTESSNETLVRIDQNARTMRELQDSVALIAADAKGMEQKTKQLNEKLLVVGGVVRSSRASLNSVDRKLSGTAGMMGGFKRAVATSKRDAETVVREVGVIDREIGVMDQQIKRTIGLMNVTTPQTRAFAENRTRLAISGGDGRRYESPNLVAGNSVLGVVLPMINTMQMGGPIAARKDGAQASNAVIATALRYQVPNGTNISANVLPFDGYYGLPGPEYFVNNRVNGF